MKSKLEKILATALTGIFLGVAALNFNGCEGGSRGKKVSKEIIAAYDSGSKQAKKVYDEESAINGLIYAYKKEFDKNPSSLEDLNKIEKSFTKSLEYPWQFYSDKELEIKIALKGSEKAKELGEKIEKKGGFTLIKEKLTKSEELKKYLFLYEGGYKIDFKKITNNLIYESAGEGNAPKEMVWTTNFGFPNAFVIKQKPELAIFFSAFIDYIKNPQIFIVPKVSIDEKKLNLEAYIFADEIFLKNNEPIEALYGEETEEQNKSLDEDFFKYSTKNLMGSKLKFEKLNFTQKEVIINQNGWENLEKDEAKRYMEGLEKRYPKEKLNENYGKPVYGSKINWECDIGRENYPILILKTKKGNIAMRTSSR